MLSSQSSSSSDFFSDDEDAYRRDYQLEREYQADDLAKGGLKLDVTESEKRINNTEKQPEVVRQTNQAFLHSSKFTKSGGMINDNIARSLEESMKDILQKVDSGPEQPVTNSRFSRFYRGRTQQSEQASVADQILTNVQRTTEYAATQLKPIVLSRAGKVIANDTSNTSIDSGPGSSVRPAIVTSSSKHCSSSAFPFY